MRAEPPESLVELLEQLGLATSAQVRGVYRRAKRLARDLPLFKSVWVDALAQARILTHFQAREINADRGRQLGLGPYVLLQPLGSLGYVVVYRAQRRVDREVVRLAAFDLPDGDWEPTRAALEKLAASSGKIEAEGLAPIRDVGIDGHRGFAVGEHVEGQAASQWMVRNGRFPPEVVLEIARQMLPGLVVLEAAGQCHGDIGAGSLVLCDDGRAVLPHPGLRTVVRPEEGYARADLLPEAYDYLAPERITDAAPATATTDLYSCGCLWWHLLAGRAPIPGATGLAKLRGAQTARISEIQRLAPETPGPLAAAVRACMQRDPSRRPGSMAELAARLGPSTHAGRMALSRCLAKPSQGAGRWTQSIRTIKRSSQTPLWMTGIAGCLVAAVTLAWLIATARGPVPPASIAGGPVQDGVPSPLVPPAPDGFPDRARQSDTTAVDLKQRPAMDRPAPAPRSRMPAAAGGPRAEHSPRGTSIRAVERAADLVLSCKGPLSLDSLDLRPGQRVCGQDGARPLVVVPPDGLNVAVEDVRFENIDFVRGDFPTPASRSAHSAPIVHLQASCAHFRGCSFQAPGGQARPVVAIRWTHPVDRSAAATSLPSGRMELTHCVFRGVEAAVECRTLGARAVRMTNTLHLGTGPMVRLDHFPEADEPVVISFAHCTLRGALAALECRYGQIGEKPGRIAIEAAQSVFVLRDRAALLVFCGPESPTAFLGRVQWTGRGSLLAPAAPVALWRDDGGRDETLDDALLSIAGLVRSEVEFAGPPDGRPASSHVTRWQVPLRSTDPPGVNPALLFLPELPARRPAGNGG